jgi:hypothetical protein
MFCPKCSQEQSSENLRFCSRCGFQLNVVRELLVSNNLPSAANTEPHSTGRFLRKKDMTIGAIAMFFMAWRSVWATEDLSFESKITGLLINCLILCVMVNLIPAIRDFFRRFVAQRKLSAPAIDSSRSPEFISNQFNPKLFTANSTPASDGIFSGVQTAEMISPPSVTEGTTNFLNSRSKL